MANKEVKRNLSSRKDTSNYTLTDIRKEVHECVELLIALGAHMYLNDYTVNWNTRAVNRLGQCQLTSSSFSARRFNLTFNKKYFEVGNPINVHNTIMHEVLHSIPGCMNHSHDKGAWADWAAKVNKAYGYSISRTSSDDNYAEAKQQNYKYFVYCSQCDKIVARYQRTSRAVTGIQNRPQAWGCNRCGKKGHLVIQTRDTVAPKIKY